MSRSQDMFALQVWDSTAYLDPSTEPAPCAIVHLGDILSLVARHTINLNGLDCWITMPLGRAVSTYGSLGYRRMHDTDASAGKSLPCLLQARKTM